MQQFHQQVSNASPFIRLFSRFQLKLKGQLLKFGCAGDGAFADQFYGIGIFNADENWAENLGLIRAEFFEPK